MSGREPGQRGGWPLTPDTAPVLKDSVPLPCQAPPSGLVRKASGG